MDKKVVFVLTCNCFKFKSKVQIRRKINMNRDIIMGKKTTLIPH